MPYAVITGVAADRPGLVAGVTGVLSRLGCNIVDSSMTILAREFAVILIVERPESVSVADLQAAVEPLDAELGLSLTVRALREEDALRPRPSEDHAVMITVSGVDHVGITHQVAQALATLQINISDLQAQQVAADDPVYILLIEATLPPDVTPERLAAVLKPLEAELSVEIRVRPLEALTF